MTIGAADKPSSPSGIPVKVEEILRSWDLMAIATIRKERQVRDLKKRRRRPCGHRCSPLSIALCGRCCSYSCLAWSQLFTVWYLA